MLIGFAMAIPNCWVVFMCQRSYIILAFVLWNELSLGAIFGSLNCWFAVCRHDGGLSRMVTLAEAVHEAVRVEVVDDTAHMVMVTATSFWFRCLVRRSVQWGILRYLRAGLQEPLIHIGQLQGSCQGLQGSILENCADVFLLSTTKRSVWACHYLITGLLMKSRNCGNDIMSNDVQ